MRDSHPQWASPLHRVKKPLQGGAARLPPRHFTSGLVSEWYGVNTDPTGRVVSVELSDNGLVGPIATAVGNLAAPLEVLDLSGNGLTGRLVVDGVLREGSIPPEIGELEALESLHLGDNALTGPIPATMPSLAAL